ncbi:MAG TPA: malto-oligosyltrehalose trehalohydrolase [Labilithrix sp.]
MELSRRLSIGAEIVQDGVHFRVYAPKRQRVAIVLEHDRREVELAREPSGHFAALVNNLPRDARYRLRLDDERMLVPDPASRFQPEGPEGPSQVVDPRRFGWTDRDWPGIELRGQVLYEMHVGTFTREGTWAAAARELEELRRLGITCVEMMPIAEFPGRFGWGYDGVDLYSPTRVYGTPDDLRAFVDRAHALGMGVILDVVYNHFGPRGNFTALFADTFIKHGQANEWGDALDYETDANVRAYFVENAGYWIDEYHFDGLRLDATQTIEDDSPRHVLADIGARVREAARGRKTIVIAENEPCHTSLITKDGLDAVWNDDFHHAMRVAATRRCEAYLSSTRGTPQELVSAVIHGPLFQGQFYGWQKQRRGEPAWGIEAHRFVTYIENHDQVANASFGARLGTIVSHPRLRAVTTLLLLAPGTPMLFQGQEFATSAPFLFFADHEGELADLVAKGRAGFMAQFPSVRELASAFRPDDPQSFARCKLDFAERETNRPIYEMHRELLRLRREDAIFSAQRSDWIAGAVLSDRALALRFAAGSGDDRLLLVNLGLDLELETVAEPLLADPAGKSWRVLFASEDARWGGCGNPAVREDGRRTLLGDSAVVLEASP